MRRLAADTPTQSTSCLLVAEHACMAHSGRMLLLWRGRASRLSRLPLMIVSGPSQRRSRSLLCRSGALVSKMQRVAAVGPNTAAALHRLTAQPWARQHVQKHPRKAQLKQQQPAPPAAAAQGWPVQRQGRQRRLQCGAQQQDGAADSGSSSSDTHVSASRKQEEQQPAAAQEQAEALPQPGNAQSKGHQGLWRSMLSSCWALVRSSLWPLLAVHALADAAVFLLHRLSHRLTNEVAVAVLLGGALSPAAIGNMWWLSVDPALANFQTGAWRGPAQSLNGSILSAPILPHLPLLPLLPRRLPAPHLFLLPRHLPPGGGGEELGHAGHRAHLPGG